MESLNRLKDPKGRKRSSKRDPEANRQLLIEATLDTIADIGVTDTSVSRICERSGLSRGMIHLHFGGKDNLLTAAAQHFSSEYYAEMDRLTDLDSGASPEDRVMAVIEADLSEVYSIHEVQKSGMHFEASQAHTQALPVTVALRTPNLSKPCGLRSWK